jgi:hypothetical protein
VGPASRLALLAVVTCMAASGGAFAGEAEPTWARQPDYAAIQAVYPAGAQGRRTAGRSTIRCRVNADEGLTDCKVLDETPAGDGFGTKALFLARMFKVAVGEHGSTTRGQIVSASIDFTPQGFARVLPGGLVRWRGPPPEASYPGQARYTGLSGRVVLRCHIGQGGGLSGCSAVEEWPKGFGFAAAAEREGDRARVAAKTLDGAAAEGLAVEMVLITNPACVDLSEQDRRRLVCPADF